MIESNTTETSAPKRHQSIKCVVWDLDNTLWHGVLLEDSQIELRTNVVAIIQTLDKRGILNSIASKNDATTTLATLQKLGLSEYFLYPQINWNSKASSLREIARLLNIGIDTFAFIDDQPFERDEVAFELPEVLCIDANNLDHLLDLPEMNPRFITEDSAKRRLMYLSDSQRNQAEREFIGPDEEFLATLHMVFKINQAHESDLQRAEELTVRTHQLNTTGYTYSYEDLDALSQSDKHRLFISSLDDVYGTYGKIGLALVECGPTIWTIKLLLMSCRVMSRGVGTIMLNYILGLARKEGVRLQAEFVSTDRNRMMLVTYRFGGFKQVRQDGNLIIFEHDLTQIQPFPAYVEVLIED
ncbi:MAG TPA: HAD-IIIC family phosphatase [Ktedonobacteraceae bacterium]|nr:HAD-IIIC family phosphatase [Ktedonobacteraceae bacterium]